MLSIPGFLLLSSEDYQIDESVIGAGGMGHVRKGVLLNQKLMKKHGFIDLAVKFYDCKAI